MRSRDDEIECGVDLLIHESRSSNKNISNQTVQGRREIRSRYSVYGLGLSHKVLFPSFKSVE